MFGCVTWQSNIFTVSIAIRPCLVLLHEPLMNEVGFENDATINCEVTLNKMSASITALIATEDTGVDTSPVVTRML